MLQVLDHGFVRLHNASGPVRRIHAQYDAHDTDPAITARMSFNNFHKDRKIEQDLRLCDYLMSHDHSTPFEMIELWIEMKLPIFVARQFVRHRTVSINEVSGRYVTLPAEWYIPATVGGKPVGGAKQGQSDTLPLEIQDRFRKALNSQCESSYYKYLSALELGVAPEHARMFLHLNNYTHWIWKQDLHNMMHFLSKRLPKDAQFEARQYGTAILSMLEEHLPNLMQLFRKYKLHD